MRPRAVPKADFIKYVDNCAQFGDAVEFIYVTTKRGPKRQRLDYYSMLPDGIVNKANNYKYEYAKITDYGAPYREPNETYGVYVVELDGDPLHVYVGQSSKSPDVRLSIHHERGLHAARVFKRGAKGRLRPDLYGHLERYDDQQDALDMETQLAQELRGRGFRVEGGH